MGFSGNHEGSPRIMQNIHLKQHNNFDISMIFLRLLVFNLCSPLPSFDMLYAQGILMIVHDIQSNLRDYLRNCVWLVHDEIINKIG